MFFFYFVQPFVTFICRALQRKDHKLLAQSEPMPFYEEKYYLVSYDLWALTRLQFVHAPIEGFLLEFTQWRFLPFLRFVHASSKYFLFIWLDNFWVFISCLHTEISVFFSVQCYLARRRFKNDTHTLKFIWVFISCLHTEISVFFSVQCYLARRCFKNDTYTLKLIEYMHQPYWLSASFLTVFLQGFCRLSTIFARN
jgi:hypothetical protein